MVKYLCEVLEVFVILFGPCHHVQCEYWNFQDLASLSPWKSTMFHEILLHISSKHIGWNFQNDTLCRNPNLRLVTKIKACKGVGQE
jgi:hypothetical protein